MAHVVRSGLPNVYGRGLPDLPIGMVLLARLAISRATPQARLPQRGRGVTGPDPLGGVIVPTGASWLRLGPVASGLRRPERHRRVVDCGLGSRGAAG